MHEAFDYFENGPAPTTRELREGAELLLNCHGGYNLRPTIKDTPQRPETVVHADFISIDGSPDGATFISKDLINGCIQVETYRALFNPDETMHYQREWMTDLCTEPEEYEKLSPEESEFYDAWKRQTAREILGVWEYFEEC